MPSIAQLCALFLVEGRTEGPSRVIQGPRDSSRNDLLKRVQSALRDSDRKRTEWIRRAFGTSPDAPGVDALNAVMTVSGSDGIRVAKLNAGLLHARDIQFKRNESVLRDCDLIELLSRVGLAPSSSRDGDSDVESDGAFLQSSQQRDRPGYSRPLLAACAVAVATLLMFGGMHVLGRPHQIDRIEWRRDERSPAELWTLDAGGHVLWRKIFARYFFNTSIQHRLFRDTDGQARVVVSLCGGASVESKVIMLDQTGNLLWTHDLTGGYIYTDEEPLSNTWLYASDLDLQDINGDGQPELIVLARHQTGFPACLQVLRIEDGRAIAEFWHAGHIKACRVCDFDPSDRYKDLVCSVLQNKAEYISGASIPGKVDGRDVYYQGILVLQGADWFGSDSCWRGKGPPYGLGDSVNGRPYAYALLDRPFDEVHFDTGPAWAWYDDHDGRLHLSVTVVDQLYSLRIRCKPDLSDVELVPNSFAPDALDVDLVVIPADQE